MADQLQGSLAARVEAAAPPSNLTPYVVLKKSGDGWDVVQQRVTCLSREVAIREVVEKMAEADQAGTYVAVPARSWSPVRVAAKTVTTLEIEAAP